MIPPLPASEPARLRALAEQGLLDTPPEPEFDHLTALAAKFFGVPMATITLMDADRQWYKSRYGFDGITQTPRSDAFCAYTILGQGPLIVPDTWLDDRFANNPYVTGPPHVRFYAGAPLTTPEGLNLGDVGLIDTVPRTLDEAGTASLVQFAAVAMAVVKVRREIASHERTTGTLRAMETQYRRIVAHSPGMVHQFVRRPDGSAEFLFVSDSSRDILGLEPATLHRYAGAYFQLVHPEDRPGFDAAVADSMANLTTLDWEGRYVTPSGQQKWLHLSSHPDRVPNGDIFWDGVLLDVTGRKQAEEALRQAKLRAEEAQAEAERANRSKDEFLSRMSHELRTPLNAVLGFGQLLTLSSLGSRDARIVESLLKGARHLLALVDEVLDLASLEKADFGLAPGRLDVARTMQECVDLMAREAGKRGVSCRVRRPEPPGLSLWADEQRLRQIFLNLLSNAIRYNRLGGEVVLGCQTLPSGFLRFSVSDTGHGIAPEDVARLFVPFERLSQVPGEVEGAGLGLVISQRIAHAMGGSIGLESTVGRGSTFWIELPAREVPTTALPAAPALTVGEQPGSPFPVRAEAALLYVDDSAPNFEVIQMLLASRRPGWRVASALDGQKGLAMARQSAPDLILLDLQLPGLSGDKVLAALRDDPALRHVPIVILSADATARSRERLRLAGADDYVSKPFKVEDLLQRIDKALFEAPTGETGG